MRFVSVPAPVATWTAVRPYRPWRTLRFALITGAGFTLLNFALSAGDAQWQSPAAWWAALRTSLAYTVGIAFTIDACYAVANRLVRGPVTALGRVGRLAYHWVTPTIGLLIAFPIAAWWTGSIDAARPPATALALTPLGGLVFIALTTLVFYAFFAVRGRQLRAERQAAEARLRLLQAQIEPHFLFNTLANVVGLMEVDTPRAKAMLESFTEYLRASLGSLRNGEHALGDELALVEAYLRIAAVRMDDRLAFRIDVPEALRRYVVPALALQPLVENAVVHGLEPSLDGGTVRIAAEARGDRLLISVSDDGVGLGAPTPIRRGQGTALANIRERLRESCGAAGSLDLEPVSPRGTRARLTLPLRLPPR